MSRLPVDIYTYDDFRRLIKDAVAALKEKSPNFSHRWLIEKVGAKSGGWLADLLQGRLRLSDRYLPRLAVALGMTHRETEYFEALVRFNQARTEAERRLHLEKLMSFKELRIDLVGQERFDFYSAWYLPAIRELLCCIQFKGDYDELGQYLIPPISPTQSRHALEILRELGMVIKDAQGCFKPVENLVKKDKSQPSPHLKRYIQDLSELAKQSLDRFDREHRDISCLTLALSFEGFVEAKDEIKRLRRRLLEKAAKETKAKRVYQLNLQLFPLSH